MWDVIDNVVEGKAIRTRRYWIRSGGGHRFSAKAPVDIDLQRDGVRFRLRSAAILLTEEGVLVARNARDTYGYSVGGGIHMGEWSVDALRRELEEEIGGEFIIERLAAVHENFFCAQGGGVFHEVALYYLVRPRGVLCPRRDSVTCGGIPEWVECIPYEALEEPGVQIYPPWLASYIREKPEHVVHYMTDETGDARIMASAAPIPAYAQEGKGTEDGHDDGPVAGGCSKR